MELARIAARGRTTIPKAIREAMGLHEGDVLAFEVEDGHLRVCRIASGRDGYLPGLSGTMSEWASPEDEEAWRGR